MKSICVITSGSIASTPRMVRAADAFAEAGYRVRLVDADYAAWSHDLAEEMARKKPWLRSTVRWFKNRNPIRFWYTRIRHNLFQRLARESSSIDFLASSQCRVGAELVRAATSERADFIYAGTAGGIACGAIAARKLGVPYGIDLEDFHSEEQPIGTKATASDLRMEWIERKILSGARFITAGSIPIADAIQEKYHVLAKCINNLISLPSMPDMQRREPGVLRLVWFGQSIGAGRGLKVVVEAAAQSARNVHIGLLGNRTDYFETLGQIANQPGSMTRLEWLGTCMPDAIWDHCRQWDIGIASAEPKLSKNFDLALSNKMFMYLSSGLALLAAKTSGQLSIRDGIVGAAHWFDASKTDDIVQALQNWSDHPEQLDQAKRAAWESASRRWHWDHPEEKEALVNAVRNVIGTPQ